MYQFLSEDPQTRSTALEQPGQTATSSFEEAIEVTLDRVPLRRISSTSRRFQLIALESAAASATATNEKRLSRLKTNHFRDEYKAILNDITLPRSFYAKELSWMLTSWLSLQIVTSYFLTGFVEEIQDKEITDPYDQLHLVIFSMLWLAIPNLLYAAIPYYYQKIIAKTAIAIAEGKIIDDTQSLSPPIHIETAEVFNTNRSFAHVLSRIGKSCTRPLMRLHQQVRPHLHTSRDIVLIFLPNAALGLATHVSFCLRVGQLAPILKSPWFFWLEALIASACYGRMLMVIHGVNADNGSDQYGGFFHACWNLIGGRAMRQVEIQPGVWQRKSSGTIVLAYYISLGILIHELFEGKYDGSSFTKNLFDGLEETFPQHKDYLSTVAESLPITLFGWGLGILETMFEGFSEAYNGQKHTNFLKGLAILPGLFLLLGSIVQSIPTIIGLKEPLDILLHKDHSEPDMSSHNAHAADPVYGTLMMCAGSLLLLVPSIIGFGAMARDATQEIYDDSKDFLKTKLIAPVARCCSFKKVSMQKDEDSNGAVRLRERRVAELLPLLTPKHSLRPGQ